VEGLPVWRAFFYIADFLISTFKNILEKIKPAFRKGNLLPG
jgi:hypothetical protein